MSKYQRQSIYIYSNGIANVFGTVTFTCTLVTCRFTAHFFVTGLLLVVDVCFTHVLRSTGYKVRRPHRHVLKLKDNNSSDNNWPEQTNLTC